VWPWIVLLWFRFGEISFERVELLLPIFAALFDPPNGVVHRARAQPAAVDPPFLLAVEQAGAFEHAQMPRDRRRGDVERGRQVSDGSLATGETLEDTAADRIGQRGKDGVEGAGLILNHRVKC
jgi:hypothetical protein